MWQPTASINNLKKRAELIHQIRHFFNARCVLEVDTPLMASSPVTDPYLTAMETQCVVPGGVKTFYFQTSPEYAMKRLLAAGVGSIYQICKAFRNEDASSRHNPEFTMLEWYRVGFTDTELMQEMDELLQLVLACRPAEYLSYQDAFIGELGINPHTADTDHLKKLVKQYVGDIPNFIPNRDDCLQLLMSEVIEPKIGQDRPCFIYNYPASQAALAKRRIVDGVEVAARFEVYYKSVELANGYYELTDPTEQVARFHKDLQQRKAQDIEAVPIDDKLLAALQHGMPDCAGVALGIDRLIMLALNAKRLSEVIAFPIDRA